MLSINRQLSAAMLLLLIVELTSRASFSQTSISSRQSPSGNRFIVAFELSSEKGFNFTWPYEAVRPAAYDSVLLVVETMPRVVDRDGKLRSLRPCDWLKVNGRLLKPRPSWKLANQRQQFEVKLSQGRLRFLLTIPQGVVLDQQYRKARIKLYQLSKS